MERVATEARFVLSSVDAMTAVLKSGVEFSITRRKDDDMKRLLATAATALAMTISTAAPVAAQEAMAPGAPQAPSAQTNAVVYGSDGAEIGTVAGEEGGVVVLKVGERMVPIDRAAISAGANGPTIAITRAELVSQFDKGTAAYEAEFEAALKQGATVQTVDNQTFGTIANVIGDVVAVQSNEGTIKLPKDSFALNNEGDVTVRATLADVRKAMSAQPEAR
jgi:hypothetical protein